VVAMVVVGLAELVEPATEFSLMKRRTKNAKAFHR
jgi:hypothetical protein